MTALSSVASGAARLAAEEEADLSRAERVYRHLREGIRAGVYRPGHRLREVEIAAALSTSRTPVREAIRRLEADRLVEDAPGGGLAVTRLDPARVHELYMFRMAIEGMAAEMAALQAGELDLAEMSDTLERMRLAADDAAQAALLNRMFHEAIYRAARNSFLSHAIAAMTDVLALLPGTTYALPGRAAEVLLEHERVLRAIAARDPEQAARAMREHIRNASQFRLRMTAAQGLGGGQAAG
jgi:DNA-binding GntR family transcriptional regulator